MVHYFGTWAADALIAVIMLCMLALYYGSNTFNYWKKRGVPFIKPVPFFGNFKEGVLQTEYRGAIIQKFYQYAKENGHKFIGIFMSRRPAIIFTDIDLVKTVFVKDFQYFTDRGMPMDRKAEPLSANLFNLEGAEWKSLRSKLTPTFTSGRMRNMFYLVKECAVELREYLKDSAKKGEVIEVKDIVARFSTDVISTCAFGIKTNSLKDPEAEFRLMGRRVFEISPFRSFLRYLGEAVPLVRSLIPVGLMDPKVRQFFTSVFNETMQYREKNSVKRGDFLELLLHLKHGVLHDDDETANPHEAVRPAQGGGGIDEALLPAQAFVFFLAGFETSSSAVSFCLNEIAQRPDIQSRLRKEVDSVLLKYKKDTTFDALQEMHYMDQVLQETMRLYPALGAIPRVVTKPYEIPDTNVVLEKGTRVFIPAYAIHRDPEFYPDPEKFDPDRFSEEEKKERPHYCYMPFGEGPRICIGMRFAYMQMKVALAAMLFSYEFAVSEKTQLPVRLDPRSFVTASIGGIWLKVTERTDKPRID